MLPAASTTGRRLCRRLTPLLAIFVCISCDGGDILAARLDSGAQVADVVTRADTTLLLVLDPSDCFSCGIDVAKWTAFRSTGARQALLIMSRAPDKQESRQFIIRRIQPFGTLERRPLQHVQTPRAIWITSGRVSREGSLRDLRMQADVAKFLTTEPES